MFIVLSWMEIFCSLVALSYLAPYKRVQFSRGASASQAIPLMSISFLFTQNLDADYLYVGSIICKK